MYLMYLRQAFIQKLLWCVGWVEIIGGIIVGFSLGSSSRIDPSFNWKLAFPIWIGGLIAGILFIGLSELLDTMLEIKRKLSSKEND